MVFDLDGTLWDTSAACAQAWNEVLAEEGIDFRTITQEDVRVVTGKPHDDCIRITFADLPVAQVDRLIEATAVRDNEVIARLGGTLYPGVPSGLALLAERYRLFIVSNCQVGYIETFFRLSGLGDLFDDYESFGNTGNPKGMNLASVIERNGLQAPLMVGDADGDETAARFAGVPFAYVSYGFGQTLAPDYTFETFPVLVAGLT